MRLGIRRVCEFRKSKADAYYFNWGLKIATEFQQPFTPTHENMAGLELHKDQEKHQLVANLRQVFSGIGAGNVKNEGICAIEKHGHFEISGDKEVMQPVDELLAAFVSQKRMKLPRTAYVPYYKIVS